VRFASARASVSRCCARPRRRRRSSDFCHVDTIVSTTLRKAGSSLLRWATQARGPFHGDRNRRGARMTFVTRENDGSIPVAPVLVRRRSLRSADEGERASRASDDSTALANGLHRLHGPRAPSRGAFPARRRRRTRAPTRRRLEHLLVTDCERESLESPPAPHSVKDTPNVSRPAKGNERASASRCFPSSITRSRA